MPVLDVLTEASRIANPNSKSFNFNDDGIKLYINRDICDRISGMSPSEFEIIINANPGMKNFIERITA